MFDLDELDSPNEFVELYNASNIEFEINQLKIADKFSIDDLLMDAINPIIKPQSYALIVEGDYNGFYDNIIPEDVIILHVDDASIGNRLSKSDSLFLIQNGDALAILGWEASNHPNGYSLEQISFEPEFEEAWMPSIDSLGTPGSLNCVHIQTINIVIDSIFHTPEFPEPFESINLSIHLSNQGIAPSLGQLNINNNPSIDIELEAQTSQLIETQINGYNSGVHDIIVYISVVGDYDNSNNSLVREIRIPFEFDELIINEIMVNPLTGESEWIELYTHSPYLISLWGWTINDLESFQHDEGMNNVIILSESYMVISKEEMGYHTYSEFPTLNNSGDNIYLFDPT
jgi:hypothetical protein